MKITDEMVDIAADAMVAQSSADWNDVSALTSLTREHVRFGIAVIAPLIRSAALEEAARVADEFFTDTDAEEVEVIASNSIAFAIRALKDKDTRTPTEGDLL